MTEPRTALRKRRRHDGADDAIPPDVVTWFAAGCLDGGPLPWTVLLSPTSERVPGWWASWLQEHPGAVADERTRFLLEARQ